MGLVYTTRFFSFKQVAIAYSATTVFPALVCADTNTLSFLSIDETDTRWNGSRVKG
jgi:hypothetical protein